MQRIMNVYRHMRIKNKLSLLIALIILVAFAFTVVVEQYAFTIYDNQLYDKSAQLLNLSSSAIETKLKKIEQLSYNIIADEQMQNLLGALDDSKSDYERLLLRQNVIDRLINYASSESSLYSIQLLDRDGHEHSAGNTVTIDPEKKARITALAREGAGENRWVFPDRSDSALIGAREIRSFTKSNFDLQDLGTLIIRINMGKIVKSSVSEDGDLIMVSGEEVIYPQTPVFNPAVLSGSAGPSKGYFIQDVAEEKYFISHIRSAYTEWTYLNLTPFNQIFNKVIFIKELVVAVFIGIIALAILWGFRFSRSLTRPVEDLMARMKLAEKGNFKEAHLPAEGDVPLAMDEIGLLHRTFRLMVERINMLIKENFSNQLLIKETEFKALQAQINPHFLYNTLESINWIAKINRQQQISHMVESLAFLLRNSISLQEQLIPLGDEIDIVRSYVTIQRYRFEERLAFSLDVPEHCLQRKIPKLTLQPLLENAIHYALEPAIDTCTIVIRASENEDGFFLTVEDDGPGMPEDTLKRLRNGELKTNGKGIGLLNIDERIRLAFGEQYGIRVGSELGRGTKIIIALPRETEA